GAARGRQTDSGSSPPQDGRARPALRRSEPLRLRFTGFPEGSAGGDLFRQEHHGIAADSAPGAFPHYLRQGVPAPWRPDFRGPDTSHARAPDVSEVLAARIQDANRWGAGQPD